MNELASTDSCMWFRKMLDACQPIVPEDSSLSERGMEMLLKFAEQIAENPIHSCRQIRKLLASH